MDIFCSVDAVEGKEVSLVVSPRISQRPSSEKCRICFTAKCSGLISYFYFSLERGMLLLPCSRIRYNSQEISHVMLNIFPSQMMQPRAPSGCKHRLNLVQCEDGWAYRMSHYEGENRTVVIPDCLESSRHRKYLCWLWCQEKSS